MSKNEFLSQLRNKLEKLPQDETENAISYYEEYFEDAGVQNEQNVIAKLGSPADVAAVIMGELAVKYMEQGKKTTKAGLNTIWLIVLGILASPIALPLAIAAVAVIFSLVMVVLSLLFAFGITAFALLVSGAAVLIVSTFLFISDFATALFFTGYGIVSIVFGVAFFKLTRYLSKISFSAIAKITSKFLKRRDVK